MYTDYYASRDAAPPPIEQYGDCEVVWNKDRMIFPLPHPSTPLGVFKATISERTGVPVSQMKLISHGFQLKDDSVALERYRLYEDDARPQQRATSGLFRPSWAAPKRRAMPQLMLIGSPETEARVTDRDDGYSSSSAPLPPHRRPPSPSARSASTAPVRTSARSAAPDPTDELGTAARIAKLLDDTLRQNLPVVEDLEAGRPPAKPRAAAIAGELLLQSLLQLDGISVRPEWSMARKSRKDAVAAIQGALDRLDAVKAAPPPPPSGQSDAEREGASRCRATRADGR